MILCAVHFFNYYLIFIIKHLSFLKKVVINVMFCETEPFTNSTRNPLRVHAKQDSAQLLITQASYTAGRERPNTDNLPNVGHIKYQCYYIGYKSALTCACLCHFTIEGVSALYNI